MGVVPSRRRSPLVIWTLVFLASAVLLGGSFVYAAQVGDPTVQQDAVRRSQRPPRTTPTTQLGSFGGTGGGGVSSSPFDPTGPGTGPFAFTPGDFARVLPSAGCARTLEQLATVSALTFDEVVDAWNFVQTCAAAEGQTTLPRLELITSKPVEQECLATTLARTTLAYRAPTVPAAGLDRLLADCQLRGVVPAIPGLGGFGTPSASVPATPAPSLPPAPQLTTPPAGAEPAR